MRVCSRRLGAWSVRRMLIAAFRTPQGGPSLKEAIVESPFCYFTSLSNQRHVMRSQCAFKVEAVHLGLPKNKHRRSRAAFATWQYFHGLPQFELRTMPSIYRMQQDRVKVFLRHLWGRRVVSAFFSCRMGVASSRRHTTHRLPVHMQPASRLFVGDAVSQTRNLPSRLRPPWAICRASPTL